MSNWYTYTKNLTSNYLKLRLKVFFYIKDLTALILNLLKINMTILFIEDKKVKTSENRFRYFSYYKFSNRINSFICNVFHSFYN